MRSRPLAMAVIALSFSLVGCPRRINEDDAGPMPDGGGRVDAGPGIPFEGPFALDDARVLAADPTRLASGSAPCREPVLARVYRVVDGDTIDVRGEIIVLDAPVRLIGLDTPETSVPVECFGPESRAFTEQLEGRLVWITFDAECFDNFDRLLGYVHVGGGEGDFWNRQLLRRGFATTFTIAPNDQFAPTFRSDEAAAAAAGAGMWTTCF